MKWAMNSVFRSVLDDAEFKRTVQIESKAVFEGLVAKQHVSLEEISGNGVLGRTNDRQFFHFMTVGGHHHRAERPQINSNIQYIFRHRLTVFRISLAFMKSAHINLPSNCANDVETGMVEIL